MCIHAFIFSSMSGLICHGHPNQMSLYVYVDIWMPAYIRIYKLRIEGGILIRLYGAGHTREIVFLTDGGIHGHQEVYQLLEQHADTRVHCMGIGHGAHRCDPDADMRHCNSVMRCIDKKQSYVCIHIRTQHVYMCVFGRKNIKINKYV